MAVERSTFKVWSFECAACGAKRKVLQWDYQDSPVCCEQPMGHEAGPERAATVIGDEIDLVIRHGPCNEDGSPRRYRSRAELKREEFRTGWTPYGDTPKYARE